MNNLRARLAEDIVERGNFSLGDFMPDGELTSLPQAASADVLDLIREKVQTLNSLQLCRVIQQHDTGDILDLVPDWFQAKYENNGMNALEALAISSLVRAVFDIVLDDDLFDPLEYVTTLTFSFSTTLSMGRIRGEKLG